MEKMTREEYEDTILQMTETVGGLAVLAAFRFQQYRHCLTDEKAILFAINGVRVSDGMASVKGFPKTNKEHLDLLSKMMDSVHHSGQMFAEIAASLTSEEEKNDVLDDVETAIFGVRAIGELANIEEIPN